MGAMLTVCGMIFLVGVCMINMQQTNCWYADNGTFTWRHADVPYSCSDMLNLNSTHTIQLDNYNFTFTDMCKVKNDCGGWTDQNGNIYIVIKRSSEWDVFNTCNHEICHNLESAVSYMDEEIFCSNSSRYYPTCYKLMDEFGVDSR